ncbi:MAG: translation elongation factor 4 [Patescibacteria group bacterium]
MQDIRNFSIIAHIDHGKSTLADRMLEITGTVEARAMRAQVLDSMDLERERGITIKMQPVRMKWRNHTLNLIDTPGHVDFAYEVSRALSAVEGVILLVDATQGVQAQTLSVLTSARKLNRVIIPVLSKIDAPHARVDEVRSEVSLLLGISEDTILLASGKTGEGVPELLDEIIARIPAPEELLEGTQALIFDFAYSDHRGVIVYCRMFGGTLKKGDKLRFAEAKEDFIASEVGVLVPTEQARDSLVPGDIGYIVTGIKRPGIASVGDTITSVKNPSPGLAGYQNPAPVIWASIYPEGQDDFALLRQSLERLRLTDSSLSYEEEQSGIMGRGFRCGFLGMLHLEIITERLRREFNMELITTLPTTVYEVTRNNGEVLTVYSPVRFPDDGSIVRIREQWSRLSIYTPSNTLGSIVQLLHEHESQAELTETLPDGRILVVAQMPLREMMRGFFDKLKNASSGFASLSYEPVGLKDADVVRLDILVAEEVMPAFSRIVSKRRVQEEGEAMVERLERLLPQQLFVLKIQAKAMGRIIAARRKSARRKDVTGYLYGGDITRKMKLLEKQKKGKKRRQELGGGKVNIPHDVFLKVMREE